MQREERNLRDVLLKLVTVGDKIMLHMTQSGHPFQVPLTVTAIDEYYIYFKAPNLKYSSFIKARKVYFHLYNNELAIVFNKIEPDG